MRNLYDEGTARLTRNEKRPAKQLRNCFFLLFTLIAANVANAQLAITPNANAQDLAQALSGPGVTISNFSRTGNATSGLFTATGTNLGIASGVVLSTGNVQYIAQSANMFASSSFTGAGDTELQTLTTGTVQDKAVLEFDVTPQGNVLMFRYVFASEEYPEWVCTQFNDVFGFFISGPKPGGGNYASENIAKIPNSSLPVAINTINPGVSGAYGLPANCQSLAHSSLYRHNLSQPINTHIVYDGMTVVLTAVASVVPCQSYHLKLAVADVSDRIYDSGVFLEANSITSIPVSITSSTQLQSSGYNSAYEGCVNGKFTFSLPSVQPADIQFGIQISGSAVNGVDYTSIPSVVTIPAGSLSTDITITPTQDGIAEADEDVVVEVQNPCTGQPISSAMLMIKDDEPANVSANQSTLCNGQTSQLIASGGLTYTWTPTNGLNNASIYNPVASPATTTTYTVTMAWGSCNKTATKTITVGGSPISLTAQPGNQSCDGSPVQLTANAGTGATYNWNGGNNSANLTAATTGTYTVTATDAAGCSSTASASVVVSNLGIGSPAIAPACGGVSNGGINITTTGNSGPYTYQWSNNTQNEDLQNVAAGSYTVTVTNQHGCTVSRTYAVNQVTGNLQLTPTINHVTCSGGNTGSIQVAVSGGNAPYNYAWSNGGSSNQINNLGAGEYVVNITDANGCKTADTLSVVQANGIQLTTTKTDVTCNGSNNGTATLTVTGGNGVNTFIWNDGSQLQNRTNLQAGTYTVTATDGTGCSAVSTLSIAQPAAISIQMAATPSACNTANGSVQATVSNGAGAYNYAWSHNSNVNTATINNLQPGSFMVTVTDANNCSATAGTTVNATGSQANANFNFTGNFCEGSGAVNFTHTGGSVNSHYWNFGGNQTATTANASYSFTAAGTYPVLHVVTNGYCTDSVIKNVTINSRPSVTATVNHVSCNNTANGNIQLSVSGGASPYQYLWTTGYTTNSIINLVAGNYGVTVTDQNQCRTVYTTAITQSSSLGITETHVNPTCYGNLTGSVQVSINGGSGNYTYNWSNGGSTQTLSNLAAGQYGLTVSDASNCSATALIAITEPAELTATYNKHDVSCNGLTDGSVQVTVNGGTGQYLYRWSNGATTQHLQGVKAGYYTLTVTDANGCTTQLNATVDEPTALSINIAKNNPQCYGINNGELTAQVTGGTAPYRYVWNNGATVAVLTNMAAGSYMVTAIDDAGCVANESAALTQPAALAISENVTAVGCINPASGAIQLSVSGGTPAYTFNWNNGGNTAAINSLTAGNYQVVVTDAYNCEVQKIITVGNAPQVTVSTTVTDAACAGVNNGKAEAQVSGGTAPYQYNWSNGAIGQSLNNLPEGNYTVLVKDALGCSQTATAVVNRNQGLQVAAEVEQPNCIIAEGSIYLQLQNGTAPYTIQWNNGAVSSALDGIAPGSYSVTVRDANQCSFDSTFVINAPTALNITATGTTSITLGETAELNVTAGNNADVTYSWLPAQGLLCSSCDNLTVAPTESTEYVVEATDANGCKARATIAVEVIKDHGIFLPNAFTPNGDGNNDLLELYGNLGGIKYFSLLVFNRWGEKVFESNSPYFKWDGTYKGDKQEPASYIYVMKVVHVDGSSSRTFKGSINIL